MFFCCFSTKFALNTEFHIEETNLFTQEFGLHLHAAELTVTDGEIGAQIIFVGYFQTRRARLSPP